MLLKKQKNINLCKQAALLPAKQATGHQTLYSKSSRKHSTKPKRLPFKSNTDRRAAIGLLLSCGKTIWAQPQYSKGVRTKGSAPLNNRSPKGCVPQSNTSCHTASSASHTLRAHTTGMPLRHNNTSRENTWAGKCLSENHPRLSDRPKCKRRTENAASHDLSAAVKEGCCISHCSFSDRPSGSCSCQFNVCCMRTPR